MNIIDQINGLDDFVAANTTGNLCAELRNRLAQIREQAEAHVEDEKAHLLLKQEHAKLKADKPDTDRPRIIADPFFGAGGVDNLI